MSRLEAPDKIEDIVGTKRHPTEHMARMVSEEQRIYILHSEACLALGLDLRLCEFSKALDLGIDLPSWDNFQDQPVIVTISEDYYDLEPTQKDVTT